jgi:cholest-4-en-3-one 26-monooxygenase
MWYAAANRDPAVFDDPHRFDIGRSPNEHLAFGAGGPHFCLGANLARLEIRVMFDELLDRLPDMELNGPVERLRSNFINGIKHLPVRFTPSRKIG